MQETSVPKEVLVTLAQNIVGAISSTEDLQLLRNAQSGTTVELKTITEKIDSVCARLAKTDHNLMVQMAVNAEALQLLEDLSQTLPALTQQVCGKSEGITNPLLERITEHNSAMGQKISDLENQPLRQIPTILTALCDECYSICYDITDLQKMVDENVNSIPQDIEPALYFKTKLIVEHSITEPVDIDVMRQLITEAKNQWNTNLVESLCQSLLEEKKLPFKQVMTAHGHIIRVLYEVPQLPLAPVPTEEINPYINDDVVEEVAASVVKELPQKTIADEARSSDIVITLSAKETETEEEQVEELPLLKNHKMPTEYTRHLREISNSRHHELYDMDAFINDPQAYRMLYALVVLLPRTNPNLLTFKTVLDTLEPHFPGQTVTNDMERALTYAKHIFLDAKDQRDENLNSLTLKIWKKLAGARRDCKQDFRLPQDGDEEVVAGLVAEQTGPVTTEEASKKIVPLQGTLVTISPLGVITLQGNDIQFPTRLYEVDGEIPTIARLQVAGTLSPKVEANYFRLLEEIAQVTRGAHYALHELTVREITLLRKVLEEVSEHTQNQRSEWLMEVVLPYLPDGVVEQLSMNDMRSLEYYRNRHKGSVEGAFTPISERGQETLARIALTGDDDRTGNRMLFHTKHLRQNWSVDTTTDPITILALERFLVTVCESRYEILNSAVVEDLRGVLNIYTNTIRPVVDELRKTNPDPKSELGKLLWSIEKTHEFLWKANNFYEGRYRASGAQYFTFPYMRAAAKAMQIFYVNVSRLAGVPVQTGTFEELEDLQLPELI